jgi:hypothetical protein
MISIDLNDFIKYKVKDKMGCAIYGYGTVEHLVEDKVWLKEGGIISKDEVIAKYEPIKEVA